MNRQFRSGVRGVAVVAIAAAALTGGAASAQAATGTSARWCGHFGYADCHPRDAGLFSVLDDTVTGLVGDRFGYGYGYGGGRPYLPGFF
jgi:hypothetical protein